MDFNKKTSKEIDTHSDEARTNAAKKLQQSQDNKTIKGTAENEIDEYGDTTGYMNDANSSMDRDTGGNTALGWDAEVSRTSRHK